MKYKSILVFLAAFILSAFTASAEEAAPGNAPAAPPVPVEQPAAQPVAKKPEEDNEPSAFKRRLQAMAAVLTGNHAPLADSADKDAIIAKLNAAIAGKDGEIAALNTRLAAQEKEAMEVIQSIVSGKADAKTIADNAVAAAAAKILSDGITARAKAVGVPDEMLENNADPALVAITPENKEAIKSRICRNAMEAIGYRFPSAN